MEHTLTCEVCNGAFTASRSDARTCGNSCRQALRRAGMSPTQKRVEHAARAERARRDAKARAELTASIDAGGFGAGFVAESRLRSRR